MQLFVYFSGRQVQRPNSLRGFQTYKLDWIPIKIIAGRNILEGLMVVNELCSWAKAKGRKMLLFKEDFNKAFDYVN